MLQLGTKRERLLGWIRKGDPKDVPVLMGPGFEVAASYLGKDEKDVTWSDAIEVAEKTDTHNIACVYGPSPFDAVPFLDDIRMNENWNDLPDGTRQLTRQIESPEGIMKEIIEFPKDKGACRREFFVKGEKELSAFAYFIRKTTSAVKENPEVRRKIDEKIKNKKEEIQEVFPTSIWIFCPVVELTSSFYMDQETAIYIMYDHKNLMEDLMDYHWKMTQVWLELAADNKIDIYIYAINGLEWLSTDLYERYMIPQARRINEFADSEGKLSWIHTCGKMKKLANMKTYQKMKVNVVESLSSPPTGDMDTLAETRRDIGSEIVTRGGINVEFFYGDDIETLIKRAEHVLDSTAGYRHMLGDTNPSYPAYPWENIKAVIDSVRKQGRLFE